LIGIVEGAILVATPALVRDFSPQLGRASAMGFWTIGPVAGSLISSIVALHTLNHFGQTHWKSQFVIAGCAALLVFVISIFALKDLSLRLRDQLMVSARDQALVEARARGLTDHQLLEAAERPWRQILKWDLVAASLGISLFLLLYYAAASLFTVYYPVIFKNPNGTNFTVTQANGLNTWFWVADLVGLIVVGLLSDALRVRKPFMVVGSVFSIVVLLIFLRNATHPHTGYYTLAVEAAMLGVGIALVFAPWIASFTESVEEKNPALVATGLALWGWVLRITIGAALIVITLIITSVNPVVDNLPVANTVIHGQTVANFVAEHPKTIAFAQSHTALLAILAKDPAAAAAVGADPSPANIAAAEKAFGLSGLTQLAKYKTQLATLVQPYQDQLTFIQAHQSALQTLEKGSAQAPHQWQHWFYVDVAGMLVFIPVIWLTGGRWRPSSARRDAEAHQAAVAEELARLIGQQPVTI
jgi:MFS family permease